MIVETLENFELIESYPEDKYLPSYLIYSINNGIIFHALIADDQESGNVRFITAYHPDPEYDALALIKTLCSDPHY